jgi:hypothetical protein
MKKTHSLTLFVDLPVFVVNDLIVRCAMDDLVWILDAGNCFDPYRIIRQIRRQTPLVKSILGRIRIARAFTCFQVVSLLEQTQIFEGSVFLPRLLTTFADEMIPLHDRLRLLRHVDHQITRLNDCAPITVTLNIARLECGPVMDWCSRLQKRADKVFLPERVSDCHPPTLF